MTVIPATDDVDTAGFFQAAAEGRLTVRRCSGCDAVLHMPVAHCRYCGGFEGRWADVSPTGRIYSYSVVAHQVHPQFPAPYTVLLVELDDLPEVRFVGRLDGRPEVHIGQAVVARFAQLSADVGLPTWELA